MRQKKIKPRGYRSYPLEERVVSTSFPEGMSQVGETCYVPLKDFRELQRRYVRLFKRTQRNKSKGDWRRHIQ